MPAVVATNADPDPHWKRLRDGAPLYYVEEVIKRFPEWAVDVNRAELSPTSSRGWETLSVSIP